MDVVTAYLNGDLNERIYMEKPESFDRFFGGHKDEVLLLKKSIYSLKQSGRQWYQKLDKTLKELSLKPLRNEPCIYYRRTKDDIILVGIYVDDLIIATKRRKTMIELKKCLSEKFEMKDLGPINYCLGVEFKQDIVSKEITMCQRRYAEEVLERFNMKDCKSISTPLDANSKLEARKETSDEDMNFPYQSLIGSLMYLAIFTRPDIAYPVNALSQFNSNFSTQHVTAGKRILRYLKGTLDLGLKFVKTNERLEGFADADWASDVNDRRSYTGYLFKMSGTAVCWEAKKQRTVALSSTEAEYVAISKCSREAVYLRALLIELSFMKADSPIVIYNDNQSAAKLVDNPIMHQTTKHIDTRYHFVREAAEDGKIEIHYMKTDEMPADILTKGLFKPKHQLFLKKMGLQCLD